MINILTIISFLFAHKFYVSVSYIEYDKERKAIEVQKKIFFDDLEFVIKEKHKNHMILGAKVTVYFVSKSPKKLTSEQEKNIFCN